MNKLSLTCLQVDEIIISRKKEHDAIKSCYERCISGSYELGLISGVSGSGKTLHLHALRFNLALCSNTSFIDLKVNLGLQ
jgi:hypothetical protein